LSGTAIALPGTGTVDSGDIKNNTVRSKDVRNNNLRSGDVRNSTLTGTDVRNDSLTGADINESTLGQVPSANTANSATTAGTAANANNLGGQPPSAYAGANETIPFSFELGNGGTRTIATRGALTLSAGCSINDGGTDHGELLIATSQDNSTMDDNNGDEFSDWDVVDSPATIFSNSVATDGVEFESTNGGAGVIASAPDGSTLITTNEGVGFNLFGRDDTCYFAGVAVLPGA
jgi:hypothetical protein